VAGDPNLPAVSALLRGRYRVIHRLPWNGLALVYLCERLAAPGSNDAGRRVAVALLPLDCERSPELIAPFLRQAQLVASIDDPHVVPVTDHGVVEGVPFFELRYENAPTLAEVLVSPDGSGLAHVDPERALDIARQLLRGLVSMHAHGVCHWDLTPSNLLLAIDTHGWDQVRLVGAGIGALVRQAPDHLTAGHARRGSGPLAERYLAPEIRSGGLLDRRADLHSAGMVLLHLLARALPAAETDVTRALPDHPALAAVIARAIADDPADRYASARGMIAALQDPEGEAEGDASQPTLQIAVVGDDVRDPEVGAGSLAPTTSANRRSTVPPRRGKRGRGTAVAVAVGAVVLGVGSAVASGVLFTGSGLGAAWARGAGSAAPARAPASSGRAGAAGEVAQAAPADEGGAPAAAPESGRARGPAGDGDDASGTAGDAAEAVPANADLAFDLADATAPEAVDPLADDLPPALAGYHERVARGEKLSRQEINDLFGWVNGHKNDVRGHLVLAHAFMNLGWRTDALDRYRYAGRADADRARDDPKLLPDLMEMLRHDDLSAEAALAIRELVGPDALPLVRTAYETEPSWTIRRRLQILERRLERLDEEQRGASRD